MPVHAAWLVSVALIFAVACSKEPTTPVEAASAPATDQLCAEHGVLEAVCTKCNPKLAPVFQAKGDWCAEHGFPESFCPVCHPERGGRPAVSVDSADDPPPDRLKVRLDSVKTSRIVGIATERGEAAGAGEGLVVPVR